MVQPRDCAVLPLGPHSAGRQNEAASTWLWQGWGSPALLQAWPPTPMVVASVCMLVPG